MKPIQMTVPITIKTSFSVHVTPRQVAQALIQHVCNTLDSPYVENLPLDTDGEKILYGCSRQYIGTSANLAQLVRAANSILHQDETAIADIH